MSGWSEISVIVLTRDSERLLAGALASVPARAEIIVADDNSTDRSRAIARSFGARVIRQDRDLVRAWGGNFDLARNQAMALASRDWLFILDSDEEITRSLAGEVVEAIRTAPVFAAWDMPRRNLFWDREVRLLGEDRQVRLLRRGSGRYQGMRLHRPLEVEGPVGHLRAPLVHHNITCLHDIRRRFTTCLPVEQRTAAQDSPAPLRTGLRMTRYYLLHQQAWRDGWRGILVSCIYGLYHGLACLPTRT